MAKRSRRARRQESQKPTQPTITRQPAAAEEATAQPPEAVVSPKKAEGLPVNNRKIVDFIQEYAHVYYDMRNVLLISILMFVVLVALSFAI